MHRKQGMLSAGISGCSIGCAIRSLNRVRGTTIPYNNHRLLADELDIPEGLLHLNDLYFECMPGIQKLAWPEAFFRAIPVGMDLSDVIPRFVLWLLVDPEFGVVRLVTTAGAVKAIRKAAMPYKRLINGYPVYGEDWDTVVAELSAASAAIRIRNMEYTAYEPLSMAEAFAMDAALFAVNRSLINGMCPNPEFVAMNAIRARQAAGSLNSYLIAAPEHLLELMRVTRKRG